MIGGRVARTAASVGVALSVFGMAGGSLASPPVRPVIENAWCLAAARSSNAAGYLTIRNPGDHPDRLMTVTSAIAQGVAIHQSRMSGGMAGMAMAQSIEIPPHSAVTFAPGGYHIMLEGLKRTLAPGQGVPVLLWFKSAGPVQATLSVRLRPPETAKPAPMKM